MLITRGGTLGKRLWADGGSVGAQPPPGVFWRLLAGEFADGHEHRACAPVVLIAIQFTGGFG